MTKTFFDRAYANVIFYGLIAVIWFAALFDAAHDLWSASGAFGALTILFGVFSLGRLRDKKPLRLPLLLPITICLLSFWLSTKSSYDLEAAWLEIWGWFFTFLLFYLFVNIVETRQQTERFLRLAGAVVIPLALIALKQQFSRYGLVLGQGEVHATLVNSLVLAGFILYWPLLYWEAMLRDRRYAALLFACLLTLVLARSRWAFASLALGFVYAKWNRRTLLTILVLSGIGAWCFLIYKEQDISASNRWSYWLTALRMWRHHPWTGVGLGGFGTAYPYFKAGNIENTRFAHGILMQLLSESGTLGMLAVLAAATQYWVTRFKTAASTSSAYITGFDITLWIVLAYSLMSINLDYLVNKLTLFLFVGATLTTLPLKPYRISRLWMACVCASLLLVTPWWVSLYMASRLYTSGVCYEQAGNTEKALQLYRDAIGLESFHAESCWRLAKIYQEKYKREHRREDIVNAQAYLNQAIRCKKDVRFVRDWKELNRPSGLE